ncbi:O-antigen ligase family protein [Desulfonatronovibrio magnus]|uniref:O-antigen ligase family protein n=1 Tax=Desulfonatronovibrio magnus TaxID=698827 RepID=UPI0005EB1C4A|nr:O-antigen ligase family protein [Desulfonatronovibrio magnus]
MFFLIILIPFTLSFVIPLNNFLLLDFITPVLFLFTFAKVLKHGNMLIPRHSFLFFSAILILIHVAIIHYILNPVFGSTFFGGESGIRQYYSIFTGVCIFFHSLWVSRYFIPIGDNFWMKFLQWLIIACVAFGILRIVSHFSGFDLPFWEGRFAYTAISIDPGMGGRIGGLAELGTVGLAALLAVYYDNRFDLKFIIIISIFTFFIVMSGGRAASVGAFICVLIFFFLIQKSLARFAFIIAIFFTLILSATIFAPLDAQFSRISNLEGGMEELSPHRHAFQLALLDHFLEKPWLGQGIGTKIQLIGPDGNYISSNITWGHGTYTSILAIFGILGGIYLFIFLFGSTIKMYFFKRKYINLTNNINDGIIILIFCILNLIILSIRFIAEGNGFNFPILFCFVGLGIGTISKMDHLLKHPNSNYTTIQIIKK